MTPVHPIEISGPARRPRDRRSAGWRRGAVFQVPGDEPAANAERLPAAPAAQGTALIALAATTAPDVKQAGHASHAFVETVARATRAPQRVTGWFVDLIV